jgi:hypothetical protein
MSLPQWFSEEIGELQKEDEKIAAIRATAKRCDDTTSMAIAALDTFISEVNSLEPTLMPLHNETKKVMQAQTHIAQTLQEVAAVKENLDIIQRAEGVFTTERIQNDYQSYVSSLQSLQQAQAFWTRNSSFKHADRTIKHLREIIAKAINGCAEEFDRLLSAYSKPMDPSLLISVASRTVRQSSHLADAAATANPTADALELIPPAIVARLSTLARDMDGAGSRQFLASLRTHRGAVLKTSMKKASALATTAGDPGEELGLGAHQAGYQRGTHRLLVWTEAFVELLEAEIDLWQRVVEDTSVDRDEFDNAYGSSVVDVADSWSRMMEAGLKGGGKAAKTEGADVAGNMGDVRNKLLVLLDVLGYLSQSQGRLREVLRRSVDHIDQMGRVSDLRLALHDLIDAVVARLVTDGVGSSRESKLRKDGTVAAATVETTAFVHALGRFRDVLVQANPEPVAQALISLAGGSVKANAAAMDSYKASAARQANQIDLRLLVGDKASPQGIPLADAVVWAILCGLERRLSQQAAEAFSSNPALSALFMMNNVYHVLQATQDVMRHPAFDEHYNAVLQKARLAYMDATWNKLLVCISLGDKEQIIAQCTATTVTNKAKNAIKRKFSQFNEEFIAIANKHSKFAIPDASLRSQQRSDCVDVLVPKYKAFLDTYAQLPFTTKPGKYIMYKAEVVEAMINKFYDEMS